MTESGPRSKDQNPAVGGYAALMAKPSGDIIETPIKANFREGLSGWSTSARRRGAQGAGRHALKTADSGY